MKIRTECLIVSSEQCFQNLGQPWDVYTDVSQVGHKKEEGDWAGLSTDCSQER